ncbi:hypothetical protein KAJ83_14585 [Marivibrio halodurans]|uniref:Uncharacterized protein n=2 Tax=Marivibrio halodurans TaxID=2039722 RepID=A0A8J7V4Z4_9PROT|nr:hypothetical protein [Marivibrio halodurans]
MEDHEFFAIIAAAVIAAGVVVVAMVLFRKRIAFSVEWGNKRMSLEGENDPARETQRRGRAAPSPAGSIKAGGNISIANGDGTVSIGGDVKDSTIGTGSASAQDKRP